MRSPGLAILASLAATATWAGPNLLVNPDFTAGTPGQEEFGWNVRRGAGEDVVDMRVDTEIGYQGGTSLFIAQRAPVYSSFSQILDTKPHTIYAAEVWVRGEDILSVGRGPRLFIGNERGNTVTADRFEDHWSGGPWRRLQCVFNSGERTRMCVVPMVHNATGKTWFSRPSLREVTPEEAAEVSGRHHGWGLMAAQPETGFAYFGRDVAHVCPDFPCAVWFSLKMNFSDPAQSKPKVVMELPGGVSVAGAYSQWSIETQPTPDGSRCELFGPTVNYCPLFLTTTWRPGRKGQARLWVEWEGGRQQDPFLVALECIAIPRAERPKRLIAGLSGPPGAGYPGDFIEHARHLGFNRINLWTSAAWVDPPSEDFVREVNAYRDAGFWVSDNYSPLRYKEYLELLAREEEAQACNIAGERIPQIPCPSYRGNAYLFEGGRIANMAASGISNAHMDEEVWNGHGICFCERCLRRWGEYRQERYPDLPSTSPREFESNPAQYLPLHEAWVRFKCQMVTEMFAGWREMLLAKVKERGARSSPAPWLDSWLSVGTELGAMYYNLHDPWSLPEGLDHLVPMIYDPACVVREKLAPLVEAAGRDHVVVGLTAGQPGGGRQIFPEGESRAQVLEGVFAPTMGYVMWTYTRSDAGTMAELARTHTLMARIEDTVLDGRPTGRLSVAQGAAHLSAFESGDEIVAFVRDYDAPGQVVLRVAGTASWRVTDADTGRQVARIEGDRRQIPVDLRESNAQVLRLLRD